MNSMIFVPITKTTTQFDRPFVVMQKSFALMGAEKVIRLLRSLTTDLLLEL